MQRPVRTAGDWLTRLWRTDAPLTGAALVLLAALAAFVVGLIVDKRIITGAPAWLKPAKFAISLAIYTGTLAWIFTYLPAWVRTRRLVGHITAVVALLEVAIIALQAWRGTTSHFNFATPLDGILFSTMGLAIVLQTAVTFAVGVALWRQKFANETLGWALRFGLMITLIGASSGGLMTTPTASQLEQARLVGRLPVGGAHTVGGPDGGPGVLGTGWSVEHGDLRVAHFLGLHAIQVLALLALAFGRMRGNDAGRQRLMFIAAGSYISLFGLLLWQALLGQSFIAPDRTMTIAFAAWALATVGSGWTVAARHAAHSHATSIDVS